MEVADQRNCGWAWRGAIAGRFLAGSLEDVLKEDCDKPEDKEGKKILNDSHGGYWAWRKLANIQWVKLCFELNPPAFITSSLSIFHFKG